MQDAYITDGHAFPYKVEVDLNMLHMLCNTPCYSFS
jgi:hypothetical protein